MRRYQKGAAVDEFQVLENGKDLEYPRFMRDFRKESHLAPLSHFWHLIPDPSLREDFYVLINIFYIRISSFIFLNRHNGFI